MTAKSHGIKRRDFLKQGTLAGLGALLGNFIVRTSYAASRERLTILSSIGLDTLHPYAHSSSPHYGIWNNMIEPLVEVNYAKRDYFGVLAESWQFQGKKWIFKLRKNIRFHDGSPFTAQDVIYSISRMKNDKASLQKENFRDLVEMHHGGAECGFSRSIAESLHPRENRNRSAGWRPCGTQAGRHGTLPIRQLAARWQSGDDAQR